ncbi:MAG TPA: DUF4159 domain-containing protein [Bacteroidales bacterium]|nr:DUF4159 domain-containing protein [Bacteroidales bacterium]HRW97259.1 DUF4159 domain-containing protein [Bacteroidales bacterium]
MKQVIFILILALTSLSARPPAGNLQIALLKYRGGGDWYANPSALPNLIEFCNRNLGTNIDPVPATVEAGSPDIFNYPFIHMTGHGNVVFSQQEIKNLRDYLIAGGFLHADDNYGMDKYLRPQLQKIFPELELIELPFSHPIYHQKYEFKDGLPKIHEHDLKSPQGFGMIYEGRLVIFYSYETDLGDGWEDQRVHNDSEPTRLKALQMGANLIQYVFNR